MHVESQNTVSEQEGKGEDETEDDEEEEEDGQQQEVCSKTAYAKSAEIPYYSF